MTGQPAYVPTWAMFARLLILLFICATSTGWAQTRAAVGVELVLAVDTSISVSHAEYRLQMQGIADALRHPDILQAVEDQPGGVAVTLVHWSLGSRNRQAVGWHRLRNAADVFTFATKVENAARHGAGRGTSISDAIVFATKLLAQNDFAGRELKIDISGDSRHNSGPSPDAARDLAVLAGIGLALLVFLACLPTPSDEGEPPRRAAAGSEDAGVPDDEADAPG